MAKPTFGTSLKMGAAANALTTIEKTVSITPPKSSREALDSTNHNSPGGAMEAIPDGVYDPGELSGSIDFVAGDADDDAFIAAFSSDVPYYFEFTANAAAGTETFTCLGVMTEYGPDELPVSGKQTASFAIKVSGIVTQDATV